MDVTRRLEIELPEDMAEAVSARVASGQYENESAVIRQALDLLAEQDEPLEEWVRKELAAGYDAWRADPTKVYTVDEVRAHLEERRRQRSA